MGIFGSVSRLLRGLSKTRTSIEEKIESIEGREQDVDDLFFERLEEILIEADVGIRVASDLVQSVRTEAGQRRVKVRVDAIRIVREKIVEMLAEGRGIQRDGDEKPFVIFIVGVNGGGKTTTAGKLAYKYLKEGKNVLLAAADTFRAAASEQLQILAKRIGSEIITQEDGADPASVVYDSIHSAKSRACDYLIVDTAGRLHTKSNLMKELEKMTRIAGREMNGAPHEVLLVIDATTGQNGLSQAKEFLKSTGVTGTVLTKLDGTARGGIALSICREMGIPIRYVGVGEHMDDLVDFSPEEYAEGLIGKEA